MKNKNVKIGMTIKVIANTNGNNYCIDEIYRVTSVEANNIRAKSLKDPCFVGNCIAFCDFIIVNLTKDEFKKEIQTHKDEVTRIQSIIDWMTETGAETYDENEHKVWAALTTLDNENITKKEKVKLIAQLLNK